MRMKRKKHKPYFMEPPKAEAGFWDVYRIQPRYIKNAEFYAYPYYPGRPITSGPIEVFVGSFKAWSGEEAIAQARKTLIGNESTTTTKPDGF